MMPDICSRPLHLLLSVFLPFLASQTLYSAEVEKIKPSHKTKLETPSNISNQWTMTEFELVKEFKKASPTLLNLESRLAEQDFDQSKLDSDFAWRWQSEARLQDSDEEGIASFIPIFGPTYRFSTGVKKRLQQGAAISAELFTDQQTAADAGIDRATRTGLLLSGSMDLWKNLFGRIDRAQLKKQNLQTEKIRLQNELSIRASELEIRKVYWSLVANSEQIKINESLLQTSRRQLQDGLKRRGQFIADQGEVARFRAQVAERMATLDSLRVSRGLLIQALKEEVPSLAGKEIQLGAYNIEKTVNEVLLCTQRIKGETQVPWNYTRLDEVIELIAKTYQQEQVLNKKYSDVDLTLDGQLQMSGVDKGYGRSIEEFTQDGKLGYAVAINLSVPLDSSQSRAQKAKDIMNRKKFEAEKTQAQAQVKAQHLQIVSMVDLLLSSVHQLGKNSESLKQSIKSSEQKFRQARISLNDLVADQDALFRSLNSEIESKLNVVHIILDYFKVFTEDPCPINQLGV